MVAFSEPNNTFELRCCRCLQHRQWRPLEVFLITDMVLGDNINYGTFKYARKKDNQWCLPSEHQNIPAAVNECAIKLCFYQTSFAYFKIQQEKI